MTEGSVTARGGRRLVRVGVPLAIGCGMVLSALPAAAAAGVTVTRAADGSTVTVDGPVTSDDVLHVRGHIDARTSTTDLVVLAPGDGTAHVVDQGAGTLTSGDTLAFDLSTACLSYDPKRAPCSGRRPAVNGTWTAQLRGGASAVSQFTLRIPPAQPTGVAVASDSRSVTVSWQEGVESDLRSYDVLDGSGHVLAGNLAPSSVCAADGHCEKQLTGTSARSFTVQAYRATCPSCSETLASAPSQPASLSSSGTTATPVESPSSTGGTWNSGSSGSTAGSGSGSTSGTGGATTTGTGTAGATSGSGGQPGSNTTTTKSPARRPAPADPGLLQRLLPGPQAVQPPSVPGTLIAPLADGSYKPTLAYGSQTVGETVNVPDGQAPQLAGGSSDQVLGGVIDRDRLLQSIAEGLLLLVVAGHLRAWLLRTRPQ